MNRSGLSWSKLDWKDFQKVTLYLYREVNDDTAIEEFLRHGHFQSGIDLLSFQQVTGKYLCIQCKHENLTLSKLKKAISLFLAGEFANTTETFIISTTAMLQTPAIQTWITQQKLVLREQRGIAFDIWDRQRLEDRLVDHYRIVEKYFGVKEAKDHCFQPPFTMPGLLQVPNFITRHIQAFKEDVAEDLWHNTDAPRSTLTLTQLLATPGDNKAFCVIAEAYEGKSSLFQQTAWEISQLDLGIVSMLLDLKFCSVQPVEQLLDTDFGTWRTIPGKNLIILIDGLDEVPGEQFDTVVGHIRDFQKDHTSVRLAVSCRKMFYNYQHVRVSLRSFQAFELLQLHMRQIIDYLVPILDGWEKSIGFYSEMNRLGISDLLGIPFYLMHLAKWFSDPSQEMPKSKMAIANRFVDESLNISASRKIRSGLSLDKYRVKYRSALQQLALLLQIKGLNACHDDDLQELFTQDDIDLLTHSSILNTRGQQWSFINAVFQEQLAALALLKLDFTNVISLVALGGKVRKISRKWIQTLATYLSLLPEEHYDRQRVVTVIDADNIELLALSEGSKFSNEFRLEVLQKIMARTIRHQARLVVIDESNLAEFVGNDDTVVNELLKVLGGDAAIIVKIVACRTLRHVKLTTSQADCYATLAKKILVRIGDADLGRLLLEALAYYKGGDDIFLMDFIQNPLLKTAHELRQGFYQYLAAHNLIDKYYDWLLSGFNILNDHNSSTHHFGAEKRLLDLVLTTRDRGLITKLIDLIKSDIFQKQFRHNNDDTKAFYRSLAEACAEIYAYDRLIIFPIVNYLIFTGRHLYDREPNEMTAFLELTQTHSLAMRIALLTGKKAREKYAFCGAMHSSCYGDLFYAIEEGELDYAGFKTFCNGLYYSGFRDDADRLEQMAGRIFGFVNEPDPKASAYHKAEERKRKNDFLFINSRSELRLAIVRLFEIAGKEVIKTDTLYGRFDEDNPRNMINSSFLTYFIRQLAEGETVSLQTCLEKIDDDLYFNIWRADQLVNGYLTRYHPEKILKMLKIYYDEEVVCFPFAEITMESPYLMRYKAGQLMKIWAEHKWPTRDNILLEFVRINTESYRCIQHAELNKRRSVTALLLQHFADQPQLLKTRILRNLNIGLKNYSVIGSHFELCRELHITEALPFILNVIKGGDFETQHEDDYMTLYISLGGSHAELLPLFEAHQNLNDYLFMFKVKLFEQQYPTKVIERLLACLHSDTTEAERKIEAAQRLAQLKNKEGFIYLINIFRAGKSAPFDIQGRVSIWNVDTYWGLEQLRPLMFMILDEETEKLRFHNSPKHLLLEILNGFAAKNEHDLELTTSFMEQCANDLKTAYPTNSGHLAWHAEQMMERYCQINAITLTNREIKQLFRQINS